MQRAWYSSSKYSYHDKRVIMLYVFAISIIWHIGWGLLFKVELGEPKPKNIDMTETVFLGDFIHKDHLMAKLSSFEGQDSEEVIKVIEPSCTRVSMLPEKRYFIDSKERDLFYKKGLEEDYAELTIFKSLKVLKPLPKEKDEVDIEGPLKNRGLLYTGLKPEIPKWLKDQGSFNVRFKLYVDKKGRVVFIEQVLSSGDLEIDLLAKGYLKEWRFSDISKTCNTKYQWGIVEVKLASKNDKG